MSNSWPSPADEPLRPFDPYDTSPTESFPRAEHTQGQGYDFGAPDPGLPYGTPPAAPYDPSAQYFAGPQ